MKIFKLIVIFVAFFQLTSHAGNPGPGYGCLVWNQRFYVNSWYKTDFAPGNPYWGPHEYYNAQMGQSYSVVDNNNAACGTINPYSGGGNAIGSCFVLTGSDHTAPSSYSQGEVRSYTTGTVTPCPPPVGVPLDQSLVFFIVAVGGASVYFLRKSSNATTGFQI